MKRQRVRNAEYRELLGQNDEAGTAADEFDQRNIQLQRQRKIRQENVLEAQIQPGDTLQAIALRYNCTISDLKRLNKIEKEIEIHARKTIKVPVNAHTILLQTTIFDELPIVHKSGQSSPRHPTDSTSSFKDSQNIASSILDEKLLVASVSLASNSFDQNGNSSNSMRRDNYLTIPTNNRVAGSTIHEIDQNDEDFNYTDPLITPLADTNDLYTTTDEHTIQSGPHAIRGAPRSDFSCSGSDCDISWICLLVFILALCFAIPLIYIIYIAEHPDQFHHKEAEQFIIG